MKREYPDAWIQTFTGGQFWPLEPDPADVNIEDIAHALSMLCRFAGHSRRFYSVAEHSVHVGARTGLHGLLHDAAEAYVQDLVRPLKIVMPWYRDVEDRCLATIYEGLHIPMPTLDEAHAVKVADNRVLANEKLVLHHDKRKWAELETPYPDLEIECLDPDKAELLFLLEWLRFQPAVPAAMPAVEA